MMHLQRIQEKLRIASQILNYGWLSIVCLEDLTWILFRLSETDVSGFIKHTLILFIAIWFCISVIQWLVSRK